MRRCGRQIDSRSLLSGPMSQLCSMSVALSLLTCASATIRLPEEFNVEKDFSVKEKWRGVAREVRCDLCKVTVGYTADTVGANYKEDDIYDHLEKICDVEDLYNQHEMRQRTVDGQEVEGAWELVKADPKSDTPRSAHDQRWQTHAMKELCDNIIRPHDDEIKDAFMRIKRRNKKDSKAKEGRDSIIQVACESLRLCSAGGRQ